MQNIYKSLIHNLPNILYVNSSKVIDLKNPNVNYHPQNDNEYYQDILPSNIEIREFKLEENKQKISEFINKLVSGSPTNNLGDQEKEELVKKLLSAFPAKAYIISTDNTRMIINQYDKVKKELSSVGNDMNNLKPGTLLYYAISTAYSIEKNTVRWFSNLGENLFPKKMDVDLLGSDSFKDFIENAAYDPVTSKLSFGTFISYKDKKVFNTTQDTDVVLHELGHAILDHLRPGYIDNAFDLESSAVHEAFSDINAFLTAAMDKNIKVKPEDLDRPNPISSIAEYFGSMYNTQLKIKKEILENDLHTDIEKVSENKPLRELSQIKEYKPYAKLLPSEKKPHGYSLALSTTFYRAFADYAKDIGDVHRAAEEFFRVFAMGAKISPVASSTMPDFYKSIIIADILYNGSKLSKYLIKAANQSKLLKTSIEEIEREINNSKSIDVSQIREEFKKANDPKELQKKLDKLLLNLLKSNFSEFSLVKEIKANIYPGINKHLNVEAIYTYPINLKYGEKSVPVYGGVLLVFDENLNLVYSNIEKPSIEKLSQINEYLSSR